MTCFLSRGIGIRRVNVFEMKRASVRGNTKIKNIRRESIPNKSRKRGNFIEIFPNLYKLNGVKKIFDLRRGEERIGGGGGGEGKQTTFVNNV